MSILLVTEEEFLTLAEDLRLYTSETMKMEVAPWIREYVADMDDLYTELILETINNKPAGELAIPLKDYRDLFEDRLPSATTLTNTRTTDIPRDSKDQSPKHEMFHEKKNTDKGTSPKGRQKVLKNGRPRHGENQSM